LQSGRFYCAIDYDYDDAPATSKQALMSNLTTQEAPIWEAVTLVADPRQLHPDMPYKYVSSSARNNFIEPRTAFSGYLMLAFDTTQKGQLFDIEVSYDVLLQVPVYEPNGLTDGEPYGVIPDLETGTVKVGEHYYTPVAPVGVKASAGIPLRTPGALGVPRLLLPETSANATAAIDLAHLAGSTITAVHECTQANMAPMELLTEIRPTVLAAVYNSSGELLQRLDGYNPAITSGSNAGSWNTVDGLLRSFASMSVSRIMELNPTARWLVPLIWTAAKLTTKGGKQYFKVEL
jgi:hypothetical protein